MSTLVRTFGLVATLLMASAGVARAQEAEHSVARQWNERLLDAIRNDYARPTVHARNLFHASVAMWDAWAAYDDTAATYLHHERASAEDVEAAREEALSYAVYRVLSARFSYSVRSVETLLALDEQMDELGYDPAIDGVTGTSPAALGNRIAATVLAFGDKDHSNEKNRYENRSYRPLNPALLPAFPGNPTIKDANRWQPLALEFFIDQSGNPFPSGTPAFLGPEWGAVNAFALATKDRTDYRRGGFDYIVHHDPGPPPQFGGSGDAEYRAGFEQVLAWSSLLDPADGAMIDISPGARGNNTLGTNDGNGHTVNPSTGAAYAPQIVPAGDYYRVLAEFWADGPDSETPPGHWFVLANYVSDHPAVQRRIGGTGPELDPLEWDVKLYFALGGAMHDAAVTAWGIKGWYDYVRPISAIRMLCDRGQRSDPNGPSYDPGGITLVPGRVEVVTAESGAPGERHSHLRGPFSENVGKIAVRAWRGPDAIRDPQTTTAGVGWILAENWWPYQRPSFVTPPFAGYVSGHSTFSRAAAELLTAFTGDAYFPGGIGTFEARQNTFLVFEDGPSQDLTLQWATYRDAADECSLSRIYGGIHPRADDIPGRLMGAKIGPDALAKAACYYEPFATVSIDYAKVRRRHRVRRRGFIKVEGTLLTGVHGPDDVLDASGGLTFTVTFGDQRVEVGTLRPGECETLADGRIRGRSKDRLLKTTLRPSTSVPGEYRFEVRLRIPTFVQPPEGPLSLRIHAGNAVRAGTVEGCRVGGRRARLYCEK